MEPCPARPQWAGPLREDPRGRVLEVALLGLKACTCVVFRLNVVFSMPNIKLLCRFPILMTEEWNPGKAPPADRAVTKNPDSPALHVVMALTLEGTGAHGMGTSKASPTQSNVLTKDTLWLKPHFFFKDVFI